MKSADFVFSCYHFSSNPREYYYYHYHHYFNNILLLITKLTIKTSLQLISLKKKKNYTLVKALHVFTSHFIS